MEAKKYHIIFQHGWGLPPELWKPWENYLPDASKIIYNSRGYFASPTPDKTFDTSFFNIAVCHSLGCHLISENTLKNTDLLVIFGGFKHFHGDGGLTSKRSHKVIDIMLEQLKERPLEVIKNFQLKCGLTETTGFNNLNIELLIKDLTFLNKNDLNLKPFDNIPKILIFHGKKDKIVPIKRAELLHEKLKKSELIIYNETGHGLPFTHTKACIQDIMKKGLGIAGSN